MQKKTQPKTLAIVIKDQLGSAYGILSLDRDKVIDAMYLSLQGEHGILQLVLASTSMRGNTDFRWQQSAKAVPESDGSISSSPLPGYKMEKVFSISSEHNRIDFTEKEEIIRIWEWLDNDMPAEKLFEMRAEALQKIEEFKQKKKLEAEKNQKEQSEKLGQDGKESKDIIAGAVVSMDNKTEEEIIKDLKAGNIGKKVSPSRKQARNRK